MMKLKLPQILKVCAVAFIMSTALSPIPAHAEPITISLFGAAFASTLGGALVSTVIGVAASWAGAQVINWLFPPASTNSAETTTNTQRDPMEVRFGERVARSAFFGIQPLGGHWVHANEYGDATQLQLVYILADGWIDGGVQSIKVNGRAHNAYEVGATNNAHREFRVDTYGELIRIRMHDGRPGQAADANVVAQSLGWDGNKKFANMAYIAVEVTSDRDKFNGVPEFVFVTRGLRCYDPRKDSTAPGGSGNHRFNNPATWEYTTNPAVQAYHYSRGFYANGFRVLGAGYGMAQLDYDTFITAMNVCDETVSVPGGGSRRRYECHTSFEDSESYGSVMDRLCQAMGGHYAERQGRICVFAGVARSIALTITDDDLLDDAEVTFDPKASGETLVSAIQGTYTHPSDFYDTPYSALYPDEFVYTGMEPRTQDVNFPQVQNPHQAFMLARQMLYGWQIQATATIPLDIKDVIVEVNDWIQWTSNIEGNGTRIWKVTGTSYDFTKARMILTLKETTSDIYDDDAQPSDIVVPIRNRPVTAYISQISSLEVDPTIATGADGSELPALKFSYTPLFDPAVTGIRFAYRVKGTTEPVKYVIDPSPNDGQFFVSDFVAPDRRYEVNAQVIGIPGREYDWLPDWVEASADTTTIVASRALTADAYGDVNIAGLGDDVRDLIKFMRRDIRTIWDEMRDLQYHVGDQDAGNQFQYDEIRRTYSAEIDGVSSRFEEVITVSIAPINGQLEAMADAFTQLSAANEAGDINTANWRMTVLTGPTGYSRIGLETRQGGTGLYRGATTFWETPNNPALPTRIVNLANEFILSDGTAIENPFIFSGGVAVMNASRVNVIEGGLIRSFSGSSYWNLNTGAFRIATD